MLFFRNKINRLIALILLGIILTIPIIAILKAFSENSEFKFIIKNRENYEKTPELIERIEEVEEIEYIYVTPSPSSVPDTSNSNIKTNAPKPTQFTKYDDDRDEDED